MERDYINYLLNECVENIKFGGDRYTEIDFTLNCLEVVVNRDFTKAEWESASKLINDYVNSRLGGNR
jgi:hypothetical protein